MSVGKVTFFASLGIVVGIAPLQAKAQAQAVQCLVELKDRYTPETTRAGVVVRGGELQMGFLERGRDEPSAYNRSITKLHVLLTQGTDAPNWFEPGGISIEIVGFTVDFLKAPKERQDLKPSWLKVRLQRHWTLEPGPDFSVRVNRDQRAPFSYPFSYTVAFKSDLAQFVPKADLSGVHFEAFASGLAETMSSANANQAYNVDFELQDESGRIITTSRHHLRDVVNRVFLPAVSQLRADFQAGKCTPA